MMLILGIISILVGIGIIIGMVIGIRILCRMEKEMVDKYNKNEPATLTGDMIAERVVNVLAQREQLDNERAERDRLLVEYAKKKERQSSHVYSSTGRDSNVTVSEPMLIPYGLTDDEKAVLELFYNK